MVVGRSVSPILHWNKCKHAQHGNVWKNGPILGQVAYGTRPQEVVSTLNEVKCSSSNLNDSKGQSATNWSHKHQNLERWKDENTKHVHQTSCHKMSEKITDKSYQKLRPAPHFSKLGRLGCTEIFRHPGIPGIPQNLRPLLWGRIAA